MSELRIEGRRAEGLTALALFLLLMARACAYGWRYWPQLDDYIQYHNYPLSGSFWELQQTTGLLASRPLAGLADYFVWAPLFSHMLLGVAAVSLLYAAAALMLKRQLGRYFPVGPLFLVVLTLLPLGVEGTYWMSASTRVVCGLFLAALAAWAFLRWMDTGRWGWALAFVPLQMLPFGWYEQSGIFSVALIVGMGILEVIRDRKKLPPALLSLWGVPAMLLYQKLTGLLAAAGGVYSSRAEFIWPDEPYWRNTFVWEVLEQMRAVFVEGNFYTLAKGFVRSAREILSGGLLLWAVAAAALCVLFWFAASRLEGGREKKPLSPWLALLAGLLLFLAPVSLFFVLENPWFSFRGAVTSFVGLALVADTAVMALWRRLPGFGRGPAGLAAAAALVFVIAGASEIGDYRATYEQDQRLGRLTVGTLSEDLDARDNGRVGLLGVEPSFLPNQNFFYHEHIHGCTESAWAFQGLLTSLDSSRSWNVTPLPSDPIYRQWNAATNRPGGFDYLYWYDGDTLVPAVLEPAGEKAFQVLDGEGRALGRIWEEDGIGYFRTAG